MPTATYGDDDTSAASTAFVQDAIAGVTAGSFTYDVEFNTSWTNAAGASYALWSNSVPDGQTRLYSVDVAAAGATNAGVWRLMSRVTNRGGVATATNWIVTGGSSDGFSAAWLTNVGTQAVAYAVAPTNQPWAIAGRGTLFSITNALAIDGPTYSYTNGLTAYYALDETSSTRFDSGPNAQNLTDNNTVDSGTGHVNALAAFFTAANSESLTRTDSASLSLGTNTSWTLAGWFKLASAPGATARYIVFKGTTSTSSREYSIYVNTSSALEVRCGNGSTSGIATHGTTLSTNTWYFAAGWYDSTAQTLNVSLNGGTPVSASYTAGTFDGNNQFRIGASASSTYYDGWIENVGVWIGRVLTEEEITNLYNSGTGRTWPLN